VNGVFGVNGVIAKLIVIIKKEFKMKEDLDKENGNVFLYLKVN